MKLVETDTALPTDEVELEEGPPTPPRPEHRRVSVSLIFTLFVLVATVATVYLLVPERHNALMTAALDAHRGEVELELERPTPRELRAWGLALFGREVPWPEPAPGVEIIGAHATSVLNRAAALVRYRVDGEPLTIVVQRPRDAVPQVHRRSADGALCISWRRGQFSFTAVGAERQARWRELLGAP